MGYQVIRVEKLNSAARVSGRIRHAMRQKIPDHADPAKLKDNVYAIWTEGEKYLDKAVTGKMDAEERTRMAMARFRGLLPEKFRKDAVQCLEVVVTASHDDMERLLKSGKEKQYLSEALFWVADRFGGKANVVCTAVHRDESSSHLSMFVVPVATVRQKVRHKDEYVKARVLSAKRYIDGPKDLADLQTEFNQKVAKKFDLERGRHFSSAKHMNVHEYYTLTNEVARKINLEREQARQEARDMKKSKKDLER
jgi:hypothetical protein